MADFAHALAAALTGYYGTPRNDYRSHVTSSRGLRARMGALERQHGTKKAAAAAVGVSPGTWGRWASGKAKPAAASAQKVAGAYMLLLRGPLIAAKTAPTKMHIKAVVACVEQRRAPRAQSKQGAYYNKVPERMFRADRTGMISGLRNVVALWARGASRDDVAAEALSAVKNAYSSEFAFEGQSVEVELIP